MSYRRHRTAHATHGYQERPRLFSGVRAADYRPGPGPSRLQVWAHAVLSGIRRVLGVTGLTLWWAVLGVALLIVAVCTPYVFTQVLTWLHSH